jgi:hypothetical protein
LPATDTGALIFGKTGFDCFLIVTFYEELPPSLEFLAIFNLFMSVVNLVSIALISYAMPVENFPNSMLVVSIDLDND